VRPARCDRSREAISLRLDGAVSLFESALLDRHLRRCADCREFAADAAGLTQLLRAAELEQPLRPVVVPAGRRRGVRRVAAGALTAAASIAAAAAMTLSSGNEVTKGVASATPQFETGAPVPVVVAAHPTPSDRDTVPRLTMQPASVADGPVHGLFNTPVSLRS
jgi:predicted anti-sigma-YlaC factor YlaD